MLPCEGRFSTVDDIIRSMRIDRMSHVNSDGVSRRIPPDEGMSPQDQYMALRHRLFERGVLQLKDIDRVVLDRNYDLPLLSLAAVNYILFSGFRASFEPPSTAFIELWVPFELEDLVEEALTSKR